MDTYIFDDDRHLLLRSAAGRDSVYETRAIAETREMSTNFMVLAFLNKNDYQVECYNVAFISTIVSYQFSVIYWLLKKWIETWWVWAYELRVSSVAFLMKVVGIMHHQKAEFKNYFLNLNTWSFNSCRDSPGFIPWCFALSGRRKKPSVRWGEGFVFIIRWF